MAKLNIYDVRDIFGVNIKGINYRPTVVTHGTDNALR